MIGITGATGQLGQLVIEELIKRGKTNDVVALARNISKAEDFKRQGIVVRVADYSRAETWPESLKGIKTLLLISSSEVGQREAQHKTVIQAAKKAGVEHIIYTSVLRADQSTLGLAKEHLATEKAIQASGLKYTFLRNGWYLENHTEHLAPALATGLIHGAAGAGRFSSASRRDYAQAAVQVLRTSGHENKIYELAGDTSFTMNDLAAEVSNHAGKAITYMNHSFENFKSALIGAGVPEPFAQLLADSDVGAANGQLQSDAKDLSQLIGHPTTSLRDAIKKALS